MATQNRSPLWAGEDEGRRGLGKGHLRKQVGRHIDHNVNHLTSNVCCGGRRAGREEEGRKLSQSHCQVIGLALPYTCPHLQNHHPIQILQDPFLSFPWIFQILFRLGYMLMLTHIIPLLTTFFHHGAASGVPMTTRCCSLTYTLDI